MSEVMRRVARAREQRRFYHDPTGWLDAYIAWPGDSHLTDYQHEIIALIPSRKRVAVRSLHGAGKTTTAALTAIWFACTRENSAVDWKILTTASAWRHLNLYLWPEIHKWLKLVRWDELGMAVPQPRTQLLDLRLKLNHGAASAVASDEPVNIEGAHADSILYIFDESKAIPPESWDAAEGALSGGMDSGLPEAFALAISTPGEPSGRFYDIHSRKPGLEDWHPIHVTLDDAISAGRVNAQWAQQRKLQFGPNSAVYLNRVLGEFASSDEDTVVPLAWVEAAIERWHEWNDAGAIPPVQGNAVLSVDVARGGSDDTVIAFRRGQLVTGIKRVYKRDTMGVTARVQAASAEADRTLGVLPEIVVDTIGIGAGVFDRLRELGYKVHPHTGSAKAYIRDITGTYGFVNCLTGDSVVAPIGRVKKVYRSRYDGPLFRVKTASGDDFVATANHNILTPNGWKAVQSLAVGDKTVDVGGVGRDVIRKPQIGGVPAQIGEIYRATSEVFGSERVVGGAVNFHGDLPDGDVQVVTVDSGLDAVDEALGNHRDDESFIRRLHAFRAFSSLGDFDGGISGVCERSGWGVDGMLAEASPSRSSRLSLFSSQCRCHESVGVGVAANLDAVAGQYSPQAWFRDMQASHERFEGLAGLVSRNSGFDVDWSGVDADSFAFGPQADSVLAENAPDDIHVNAQRAAELVERASVDVALDEIVFIEVVDSGQRDDPFVYTLETETGMYASQHTIHRNCRSAAYWSTREMLDPANGMSVALPDDDKLIGELTSPRWSEVSGRPPSIKVEPKEDVSKRLGRSPDAADAIVMSLFRERIRRPSEATTGVSTFANATIVSSQDFNPMRQPRKALVTSPFAGLELSR